MSVVCIVDVTCKFHTYMYAYYLVFFMQSKTLLKTKQYLKSLCDTLQCIHCTCTKLSTHTQKNYFHFTKGSGLPSLFTEVDSKSISMASLATMCMMHKTLLGGNTTADLPSHFFSERGIIYVRHFRPVIHPYKASP